MPRRKEIKKVLVIGSGPIIIGQAAEFDYAGTQACKALREEGIEVVLVNSNPATIMTDLDMADRVYIEPLTVEFLKKIILRESPDGILPTLGGQTGLNLAMELSEENFLQKTGVILLGTPLEAIKKAEDREIFKQTMMDLNESIPASSIVRNLEEAINFVQEVGYPIVVRPAYTLGGSGGGLVYSERELVAQLKKGLKMSLIHQVLLEQSVAGWKEIEFEVMRDGKDACITVCSMENIDPIGIHTGDSVVVAPALTLTDSEYHALRCASLKIIRALGIEGGCNIQFAVNPHDFVYNVIEVNPRVSRSSALASKATGYPIAKVAAKIAAGYSLEEIQNAVTKKTTACFEPSIDYVVLKFPRWPFDKFVLADRKLGTQMKATGEVMSIDRTFEGAFLKALRSLEINIFGFLTGAYEDWKDEAITRELEKASDERLFVLAEAFRRDWTMERVHELTNIDNFFLFKFKKIVAIAKSFIGLELEEVTAEDLWEAKRRGFADQDLANLLNVDMMEVRALRENFCIMPTYKMVDTCAGEFEAATPYYYSTYEEEDEVEISDKRRVLVIGSGPIRIGQGVEFDYCSVHAVWALQQAGREAIIINNNPETVSTDFDCADKLYFEPLTPEDVLNIIDKEKPEGVVVQFGGQTAINLAEFLKDRGINILGTSVENIDLAENRQKFWELLQSLGISQAEGASVFTPQEAMGVALKLGFPLLIRPSYVIGGRAMFLVHNEEQMYTYLKLAAKVSPNHPVLIDKYLLGMEVEVDAISDGENILIPGIMEHIERAGIHSGDSMAVFPPRNITQKQLDTLVNYTEKIARALEIKGLVNIQFVIYKDRVYVLEVNPRASRTIPILSKVTGVPMVKLAVDIMMGARLKDLGFGIGLREHPHYMTVKAPVFSFEKLTQVDISLGPEMKSTGEVLGMDLTFIGALYKTMLAGGYSFPQKGRILFSVALQDKNDILPLAKRFAQLGFELFATAGTAESLKEYGVREIEIVKKIGEGKPNVLDLIQEGVFDLVVNTPTFGQKLSSTGYQMRRSCVELKIPCLTSPDTVQAFLEVLEMKYGEGKGFSVKTVKEYLDEFI
ncbi:carbamoyl-phosphate synthase (glutamine-hydrolyzing) large subunit [Candidatus Contubernalis alkaliaceticus]|uniref:carbamoyl-phosphate synthase (glutamine-hydrolyzing) large subunit n=1 Tax=Candidatus Contubernalis alkaliaceticus TaxID=338645 RepID=UPI001F4BF004|nr:carbamoyl-phosphate synthase (glutamine-hydrolyzing) large subunit [Candidatus Contubernalis alkalaceticus]UNC91489.1 carbamoyl-phosphate synthase (glutamine-hydrolyzing) large subunit [Candidatus Contubernalis alkalaceticus]